MPENFDAPQETPAEEAAAEAMTPTEKQELIKSLEEPSINLDRDGLKDYLAKVKGIAEQLGISAEVEAMINEKVKPMDVGGGFKPAGLAGLLYRFFNELTEELVEKPETLDDSTWE